MIIVGRRSQYFRTVCIKDKLKLNFIELHTAPSSCLKLKEDNEKNIY
jgi:hypothetical protein